MVELYILVVGFHGGKYLKCVSQNLVTLPSSLVVDLHFAQFAYNVLLSYLPLDLFSVHFRFRYGGTICSSPICWWQNCALGIQCHYIDSSLKEHIDGPAIVRLIL